MVARRVVLKVEITSHPRNAKKELARVTKALVEKPVTGGNAARILFTEKGIEFIEKGIGMLHQGDKLVMILLRRGKDAKEYGIHEAYLEGA